jgi:hypothetical protein
MKSILFISILLIALLLPAYGQEQPVSRFGKLDIRDKPDEFKHSLFFNDKEVFQYEGQSIDILEILKGSGRDFAIIAAYSGGIACPAQVVVVEILKSGQCKVSEQFGSCSDLIDARLRNNRVIVETPAYVPHPDLISKRQLKRLEKLKEVYTWYEGRLVKKVVPR